MAEQREQGGGGGGVVVVTRVSAQLDTLEELNRAGLLRPQEYAALRLEFLRDAARDYLDRADATLAARARAASRPQTTATTTTTTRNKRTRKRTTRMMDFQYYNDDDDEDFVPRAEDDEAFHGRKRTKADAKPVPPPKAAAEEIDETPPSSPNGEAEAEATDTIESFTASCEEQWAESDSTWSPASKTGALYLMPKVKEGVEGAPISPPTSWQFMFPECSVINYRKSLTHGGK